MILIIAESAYYSFVVEVFSIKDMNDEVEIDMVAFGLPSLHEVKGKPQQCANNSSCKTYIINISLLVDESKCCSHVHKHKHKQNEPPIASSPRWNVIVL